MNTTEANKIIADFMGVKVEDDCPYTEAMYEGEMTKVYGSPYFSSLDALVPVWEKLEFLHCQFNWIPDNTFNCTLSLNEEHNANSKTIQEAATIATAKAIQELGK